MSTNHYFEEVIGFSRSPRHLMAMYMTGFLLSLTLTFVAYYLATHHMLPPGPLSILLLALAGLQFIVQLRYFLHIDGANASRDRLVALAAIIIIVLIFVVGSLWIMTHLNERMSADPDQMVRYMNSQQGM